MMTEIEREQFHNDMLTIYHEAKKFGYVATRFKQMVDNKGGYETAKQLIAKQDNSTTGFTELWMHDKLNLSVEAHVAEKWSHLFTEEEAAECRRRLAEVGYTPKQPN